MKKRTTATRATFEDKIRRAQEQITRIRTSRPSQNDVAVIIEFAARGIPSAAVDPRENVFPFDAWAAFGRHVRKGEKAVAVTVWVPVNTKGANDTTATASHEAPEGETKKSLRPVTAYLFHVSQTEPFSFAHRDFWTLPESCARALILCGNVAVAAQQSQPSAVAA